MKPERFKPITVKCEYCSKEFSSSTILFHQKKSHPALPLSFSPSEIRCQQCSELIKISNISFHYSNCERSEELKNVNIIKEEESTRRAECRYCKRKFHRERIERHMLACEWASKKRPVFDILRKRMPLLDEIKLKQSPKKGVLTYRYNNSKWQQQHLQLLSNLRVETVKNPYSEYLPCPYCTRKFAPNIAENHIEICKNILNKPKPPPAFSKSPNLKNSESLRKNSFKVVQRALSVISKDSNLKSVGCLGSLNGEDNQDVSGFSPNFELGEELRRGEKKKKKRKLNKNKTVAKTLRKVRELDYCKKNLRSCALEKDENDEIMGKGMTERCDRELEE